MTRWIAACLCLVTLLGAARAEEASYALRFAGMTLGTLSYAATETGGAYAAEMRFGTGGLAGLVARVSFSARVDGRRQGDGTLRPARYREETSRGGSREVTEIVWDGDRPRITVEDPPQPDRLDPGEAAGSVDLLSGLHLIFGRAAPGRVCDRTALTYDGKRLMRLTLGPATRDPTGRIGCEGRFTRLKGAPPTGMVDMMTGGFALTYAPRPGGGLGLERMTLRTPLGRAELVAR
jgi:hypothetical protein